MRKILAGSCILLLATQVALAQTAPLVVQQQFTLNGVTYIKGQVISDTPTISAVLSSSYNLPQYVGTLGGGNIAVTPQTPANSYTLPLSVNGAVKQVAPTMLHAIAGGIDQSLTDWFTLLQTMQSSLATLTASNNLLAAQVTSLANSSALTFVLPGAIPSITVGTITSTSIAESWTQPSGSTPISYQVLDRVSGTTTFIPYGAVQAATNDVITGLNPNTSYDIEVVPDNSAGAGPPTIVYNVKTLTSIPNGAILLSNGSTITLADGSILVEK